MRYFLSGLSLVLAVVFLLLGVGQRTIWAPADTISNQLQEAVEEPVLVLTGDVLHSYDGRQDISITTENGEEVTAVVGKLTDIIGWIGLSNYAITERAEEGFTVQSMEGSESSVPRISGSDMWVQQQTAPGEVRFSLDAPEEYAVAIVTDGTAAAPSDVSVSWRFQGTTPWYGPAMTAGFVFLGLALVLLAIALRRHRKQRGPQRKSSPKPSLRERREIAKAATKALEERRVPALTAPEVESNDQAAESKPSSVPQSNADGAEAPESATEAADAPETPDASTGRALRTASPWRRIRFAAPIAMFAVVLTGCSSTDWPSVAEPSETASATPEPTSIEDTLPDPALSVQQFDRLLANTRQVVADADSNRDATLAASRLGGAVLAARQTAYEVLSTDGEALTITGIPDGSVSLVLPQQSSSWPRSVLTIVEWADSERTPTALVFEQATARENFKIVYQFELEPGATATGAAADVGAAGLPGDTPLLSVRPDVVGGNFAQVLMNGAEDDRAGLFDLEDEALNAQIGRAAWDEYTSAEEYALVDFTRGVADDDFAPITLVASPEGSAYVSTSFTVTSTTRINAEGEGATIQLSGAERALVGVDETETGTTTVYQVQVMFLVPPTDAPDDEKVTVIGYSYNLLDAAEVAP